VSTRNLHQLYLTPLTPGEVLLTMGKAQDSHVGQSLPRGFTGSMDRVERIGLLRQKSFAKYQEELHRGLIIL